jgi:hypothetical protein
MKSFKIFLLPFLATLLVTPLSASKNVDPMDQLNGLIKSTEKTWEAESSDYGRWRGERYMNGWGWEDFWQKLNEHTPVSFKEVLQGKHRRGKLLTLAMDQTQSVAHRVFAALLCLDRINQYVKAKGEAYPKNKSDKLGEDFYAQEMIQKRLSKVNPVKLLLSGLMLDADLPNKVMTESGINRHNRESTQWLVRSGMFLDSLTDKLQAEQVRSWWDRVSCSGEKNMFGFYLGRHPHIQKILDPMLKAPLARAMLNPEEALTDKEVNDYIYYLYLNNDCRDGLLSKDPTTRLAAMEKASFNCPHVCFLALHLSKSVGDAQNLSMIAKLVDKALNASSYPQRDEIAIRALSHYAPLYMKSLGQAPSVKAMEPVQQWITCFGSSDNQSVAVQAVIKQFNETYPSQTSFFRFLALNDYISESGPKALQHCLPPEHPALGVAQLATPLEKCEFLLYLVKDEQDPEIACLLARWGMAIADSAKHDTKEHGEMVYNAEKLRKDKLQIILGDYDSSDRDIWSSSNKETRTLPELEELIKQYEVVKKRMKDLSALHELEAADAAAKVALSLAGEGVCSYGDKETVMATWATRAAHGYRGGNNVAGLKRIWSLARSSLEGPYVNQDPKKHHSHFEFQDYESCISLMCRLQLSELSAGRIDASGLDCSFLPEKHFLREALLEKDPVRRIDIINEGLKTQLALANLFSVQCLGAALKIDAAKQIHAQEPNEASRQQVLEAYERVFAVEFGLSRKGPIGHFQLYMIRDLLAYTQGQDLPPAIQLAVGENFRYQLFDNASLFENLFTSAQIELLRGFFTKFHIQDHLERQSDIWTSHRGLESLPLDHPVREVMQMQATSNVESVGKLVQAKKVYELALAEQDPSLRLPLLWMAKELLREMYYDLHYEEKDSFLTESNFLTMVVLMEAEFQAIRDCSPKNKLRQLQANLFEDDWANKLETEPVAADPVQTMWESLFEDTTEADAAAEAAKAEAEKQKQEQESRIWHLKYHIKDVHKKTRSILSRSAFHIPEAAALKAAYQEVFQGAKQGYCNVERRYLSETETFLRKPYGKYLGAVKNFCEFIWMLRDDINREILSMSMDMSTKASSTERALWQVDNILLANTLLKKSFSSSELKALPAKIAEQQDEMEGFPSLSEYALFLNGMSSKRPMVLDDALLGRLTETCRDLIAYTKTNKLPETLGKKLMDAMPKDVAQVGGRFLESRVEPQGCIAYFTMKMYLKRLTSLLLDNQAGNLPEEELKAVLEDYNSTTTNAIEAFYRKPSDDYMVQIFTRYDTRNGASNVVALRIADEAWHLLKEVKDVLTHKAQSIPQVIESQLLTLRNLVITIAEGIDFGNLGGDDSKYFNGQCLLKVIPMFEDPISRCYFVDRAMHHLATATYKSGTLPDCGQMSRAFEVHQNIDSYVEWQQNRHVKYAAAVLSTCLEKLESQQEVDLFIAADYKQMALAMDKDLVLPADNERLLGLETALDAHVKLKQQELQARAKELEDRMAAAEHGEKEARRIAAFMDLRDFKQRYLVMRNDTLFSHPYAKKMIGVVPIGSRALGAIADFITKLEEPFAGLAE